MNDKNDKERRAVPVLVVDELRTNDREPGDIIGLCTPAGTARLFWLGVVTDGVSMGAAMRRMHEIAKEKENEPCQPTGSGFTLR